MEGINFGLLIRPSSFGLPIRPDELPDYNRRCIRTLSPAFTSIWMEDHLQWNNDDTLENFTTLSYLAAEFPTFHVGSLVLCQLYRNPALVAKMAANLHFLSGGRYILGIGAGWKKDEHLAYGYPLPDPQARWEQLEEAILIIRSMWTSQPTTFEGKHYQVHNAYCQPQPSCKIPILIGGGGELRTIPLAARYADWWNYNSCTIEEYAYKAALLKKQCRHIGRDIAEIVLSYSGTVNISEIPNTFITSSHKHIITGDSKEVIRELKQYCDIGITHFMLRFSSFAALERFVTTVIPHFSNI